MQEDRNGGERGGEKRGTFMMEEQDGEEGGSWREGGRNEDGRGIIRERRLKNT